MGGDDPTLEGFPVEADAELVVVEPQLSTGSNSSQVPSQASQMILSGRPLSLAKLLAQNIMDFDFVVNTLLSVFVRLLHEGYRMADKECRNEVLICLSMISTFDQATSSFMSSGALRVFTSYACIAEVGQGEWTFFDRPFAKIRNFGSIHDIDLQLKRELAYYYGCCVKRRSGCFTGRSPLRH